jgi:adenylate cyclase
MQDEIVTRLARALEIEMGAVEAARVARTQPGDQNAEDLALRCQAGVDNSAPSSAERDAAYDLCERALQIDGRNVLALTITAYKYGARAVNALSVDRQADTRHAEDLVARALALEPDNYRAHYAKSIVLNLHKHNDEALAEAERSLALNPSFLAAYNLLCLTNFYMGRPKQTMECADKAIRLNPRDPQLYSFYIEMGLAYAMLKEDAQAIEWYRRVLAVAPVFSPAQRGLAAELALNGQEAEARDMLQRYLSNKETRIRTLAQMRALRGSLSDNPAFLTEFDRIAEGLRKAGMPEE